MKRQSSSLFLPGHYALLSEERKMSLLWTLFQPSHPATFPRVGSQEEYEAQRGTKMPSERIMLLKKKSHWRCPITQGQRDELCFWEKHLARKKALTRVKRPGFCRWLCHYQRKTRLSLHGKAEPQTPRDQCLMTSSEYPSPVEGEPMSLIYGKEMLFSLFFFFLLQPVE